MTPIKTIAILCRMANDFRHEEEQLCKQFGDVIIPQSMRARRIKETKAIDAAVEMIERLEVAEKERDNANAAAAGVALHAEAMQARLEAAEKERDALLANVERMEKIESAAQNLVKMKGRHNTEIAYRRLVATLEESK